MWPSILKFTAWIGGIAVVLFCCDRLLLWMESRGWIYWRRSESSGGTGVGNALLEIQSLVEPNKEAVVEALKEEKVEQAESGDPPEPGSDNEEAD